MKAGRRETRNDGSHGVTASSTARAATNDRLLAEAVRLPATIAVRSARPALPNKPVLPTAPNAFNVASMQPLRRQTGRSLGRCEAQRIGDRMGCERRMAADNESDR